MRRLLMLFLAVSFAAAAHADGSHLVLLSKQAKFDEVKEDVVLAIESRGIKINHFNYIADMLARTGQDLGATRQIYLRGEQIEFCKSDLSRAQMEADPANMVFCPYIITLYTTPDDPERVFVGYRQPLAPGAGAATQRALAAIDALLREIVEEATR